MTGLERPLGSVTNLLTIEVNAERKIIEEIIWSVGLVLSIQDT